MKRLCASFAAVLLVWVVPIRARAQTLLVPGGQTIGLQLRDDTLTVAAYDPDCGDLAKDSGLKIGDVLEKIDGIPVSTPEEVRSALGKAGSAATVTVSRGGKRHTLSATLGAEGRLGVYLRQGISGIGTVTFFDPETGVFGALGHGVSGSRGNLLELRSGVACPVTLGDIQRGKAGSPGQLKGEADGQTILGNLTRNTARGVFGTMAADWPGEPLPVAAYGELHTGQATIRSTLDETGVQEYSVEILKIYPENRSDGRNLLLKITDEALLAKTGGVIQGMSGSPIIQNGKLVGAVTHVLVNDPTTGYGIFIENMLDAAG